MKIESKKIGRPKKGVEQPENKVYLSIFEILGDKKTSAYSQKDIDSYEGFLDGLPLAEMQRHAVNLEIIPQKTRAAMKRVLLEKYRKYMADNAGLLNERTEPKSIFEIMASEKSASTQNQKTIFDDL